MAIVKGVLIIILAYIIGLVIDLGCYMTFPMLRVLFPMIAMYCLLSKNK